MAIEVRTRFKPDIFRSSLETLIEGFDPATGSGTLVLPVQLIAFDTANVLLANYEAGDTATEKFINVLYEDVVRVDLATVSALGNAPMAQLLRDLLDAFGTQMKPSQANLSRIVRAAKRMVPRPLPA